MWLMRPALVAIVAILVGCGEADQGSAADPLSEQGDPANAWRVACAADVEPAAARGTLDKWGGWYNVCPSLPEIIPVSGQFDGASWCSVVEGLPSLAYCWDYSCDGLDKPYTATNMGRVEVAFHCGGIEPQRYYFQRR